MQGREYLDPDWLSDLSFNELCDKGVGPGAGLSQKAPTALAIRGQAPKAHKKTRSLGP